MKMKSYYSKTYTKRQLEADLARMDRLKFLFDPVPSGIKVLDIGCGPGSDVDFLLKAGNEVHGIDIADEALSHAQARGIVPHKIDLSQSSHLPFPNSSFDLIIATDILEHLFLPEQVLEECARLLKQSSMLIASVPNHFFWRMRFRIMRGGDMILPFHKQSKQWDYFHIRFFNSRGFEELLAVMGFQIIEKHYNRFINVPRGLPRVLDCKLAKWFPDLFSMHFIVKAVKK
jgi:methionine biosynthesis protein MetW